MPITAEPGSALGPEALTFAWTGAVHGIKATRTQGIIDALTEGDFPT